MDYKQENMKYNLKVKTLKSYNSDLTEGKIYDVIDISETFYGVVNDEGEAWLYYKEDFEVIKEDNIMKSYFKENSRYYKNWLIEPYGYGWRLIPNTFADDEDLYRWYNNGFSCEFTTLKGAKEYISSNRSAAYYNEVVEYFEKTRNK